MRHDLRSLMLLFILCLALSVACTHSVPKTLPRAYRPCPISEVGRVDSSWRQVRASGFTFCIPGSWGPSRPASDSLDARAWSGKEGSVTWGLGRPESISPSTTAMTMAITGTVASVGEIAPPPANPAPPLPRSDPCSRPRNTPYMVDSVMVVVTQTACRGTWTTTAWSTAPAVYVQAEAHSPEEAKALNAIMVTIRFASSGP